MKFHYEWWTVQIEDESGTFTWEFKGSSKDHVIKQINKKVTDSNSERNQQLDIWHRKPKVLKIYWETLKLDRIGHQR